MSDYHNPSAPGPPPINLPYPEDPYHSPRKKTPWVLWTIIVILCGLIGWGVWFYFYYLHASIQPVELTQPEQRVLNQKIEVLEDASQQAKGIESGSAEGALRESGRVEILSPEEQERALDQLAKDRRTIVISQRELNGLLNYNTDLGERLKFNLKPGRFDIQFVQPVPAEVPVVGGQTWRVSLDLGMNKVPGKGMELMVKELSVGGIPLPTAWLEMVGIQKNLDLMERLRTEFPAFEQIEKGIDYIDISSGQLQIRLAD